VPTRTFPIFQHLFISYFFYPVFLDAFTFFDLLFDLVLVLVALCGLGHHFSLQQLEREERIPLELCGHT
jgi:hypothetical protein